MFCCTLYHHQWNYMTVFVDCLFVLQCSHYHKNHFDKSLWNSLSCEICCGIQWMSSPLWSLSQVGGYPGWSTDCLLCWRVYCPLLLWRTALFPVRCDTKECVGVKSETYYPRGEGVGFGFNWKRIGFYPQESCSTLTECCAHFTEWTCGTRQGTVSVAVWRTRPGLQWSIKWSDGPTKPGVTSCLSCVVTVVWSEWWLITAHWCQLVSTSDILQSSLTLSTQSSGVSVVGEVDCQYKVTTDWYLFIRKMIILSNRKDIHTTTEWNKCSKSTCVNAIIVCRY